MIYDYELKVKAITAYRNGEYIENPGYCKENSWKAIIREWSNKFEINGFEGIKHKTKKLKISDKQALIKEILSGQSIKETARKYNISSSALGKWYNTYLQKGIDGLQSKWKRRNSMPKKIQKIKKKIGKSKPCKFTAEEIEYILAENEYLKKVQTLIQKKNQTKKK